MAPKEMMHWQGDRWDRTYRGKRYLVGPRTLKKEFPDLFVSNSQSGSRAAANAWWERFLATYDNEQQTTVDGEKFLRLFNRMQRANLAEVDPAELQAEIDDVGLRMDFRSIQTEALAKAKSIFEPAEKTVTCGALVAKFLEQKKTKILLGKLTEGGWDQLRIRLGKFEGYFGSEIDCRIINEDTVAGYFSYLAEKTHGKNREFGQDWADSCWGAFKQWVKYLWALRVCDLPRNLESPDHRFQSSRKTIKTFSVEDVQTLFAAKIPDRAKLYALLMLNCGFLNVDIAHLLPALVDWKKGKLTWKRHKELDKENVPTVTYKLWPETLRLLKQEVEVSKQDRKRSGTDELWLLLTEDGLQLRREKLAVKKDGKMKLAKSDAIKLALRRAIAQAGLKKNPRQMRATSSSLLETHDVYCRYEQHFLGHAPSSVASKHYVTPSQDQFDKAVDWLGQQYGFVKP